MTTKPKRKYVTKKPLDCKPDVEYTFDLHGTAVKVRVRDGRLELRGMQSLWIVPMSSNLLVIGTGFRGDS